MKIPRRLTVMPTTRILDAGITGVRRERPREYWMERWSAGLRAVAVRLVTRRGGVGGRGVGMKRSFAPHAFRHAGKLCDVD